VRKVYPKEGGAPRYEVQNKTNFKKVANRLRVLARSTVCGLKELGGIVAVTGESHNDVEALRISDVGFSLGGAGCSSAKNAADMILMDDNFGSTMRAVMWGRNIYNNIRKFL
jgi:P-type E1-E2 ATPase